VKGAALDLAPWIADYAAYLARNGYAAYAIDRRLKHLGYLNRFIEARGLQTLEHFPPEWARDFLDYWMHHHPCYGANWIRCSEPSRIIPVKGNRIRV